ncbi:MAG: hypothetical protein ACI8TV_001293, partial [Porticoccaceae bacterium]
SLILVVTFWPKERLLADHSVNYVEQSNA